jgi:crotonobetaine/carnitine-CoA ligase
MKEITGLPRRDKCVVGPLLHKWSKSCPDRTYLTFEDGTSWTFAETLSRTQSAAAGLCKLGVAQGDHVLSWLPNGQEAILTWFGANYLGAVYVPLNTAYQGGLLEHAITLSDARVMVLHASLVPRLLPIGTGRLTDLVVAGESYPEIDGLNVHTADLLATPGEAEPERPVEPWDCNYIILTSGTTGPSKAVLSTYIQTWSGSAEAMFYFKEDDRILANLPLFHVSGTGAIMDRLIKGGECVVMDGFRPSEFWATVRRHGITGCCLVGAMTQFLLKQPESGEDRDHPLRSVITVPWNEDSLALAKRFGINIYTAFNMTELAVPIVSEANPPVLGTCGRPRPGVRARVVDEHDYEVPHGETGELVLRTDRPWEISRGYYRNPEATVSAWRNGWFHTGDAFRRDEDGNFYFVDRIKDAIRRRGENISSFEVESEATAFDAVREAAAIPVPSEFGEDEVMLVVSEAPGKTVVPEDLLNFMMPRMAHFMLPRYIRVMPELPKTPTQKIQKNLLRDEGVTDDTWDREAHGFRIRKDSLR